MNNFYSAVQESGCALKFLLQKRWSLFHKCPSVDSVGINSARFVLISEIRKGLVRRVDSIVEDLLVFTITASPVKHSSNLTRLRLHDLDSRKFLVICHMV